MKFYGGIFDYDAAARELAGLNAQAEDPSLWSDPERAKKVMQARDHLQAQIDRIDHLTRELGDITDLLELAKVEGDVAIIQETVQQLEHMYHNCQRYRLETLLSGEADQNDCYIEVHAGAGGTEAQDWALMLQRMYVRWAERNGYKLEWLEEISGDEAGIKSCTFRVMGGQAYGWLKGEMGVHRLVRISPFDSGARRHTSFASVTVYPAIDDQIDIAIEEKDLRVDTYRASGAGGQHVNKTESAIRITHIPTGIVVQCQNDRSQHRNRAQAMGMLKSRLYEQELKRREAEAQADNAAKSDIGWGHQIRSYVLHPYQMVKDLRTSVEVGNPSAILDGDINIFLEAALTAKIAH